MCEDLHLFIHVHVIYEFVHVHDSNSHTTKFV